ncbi:flavodoxin family protein [Marinobacter bohaiensis]|uniref:flavodoxin family protein n=1 Tax=Marinobacter bohaiensis TaxID=2201898 RepID=UPI000DAC318E|nr:hypothetical protein [Marinobacter bohaiensis]
MAILKWLLVSLAVAAVLAALVPIVVTQIEYHQARENRQHLDARPVSDGAARSAVIVFSRSGNTAVLGQYIARKESADYFRLEASAYKLGLMGWIQAMRDARSSEAVITPQTVDLSGYDTVYLGSPIWLYSPAPPIWAFVDRNRFDGQHVVLFNTFNSNFEPGYIDAFRQNVLDRGARSFEHRFVKRGRMGQQLSIDEMIEAFDEL